MTLRLITDAEWHQMSWSAKQRWHAEARAQMRDLTARALELESHVAALMARRDELEARVIERIVWKHEDLWTDAQIKAAHAAYVRGDRDEWSVVGQRLYDRERQQARRARNRAEREAS